MSSRFQQEWLSQNGADSFPFSVGCTLPADLILDLRLFVFGSELVEVRLSSISYDSSSDSYGLLFSFVEDSSEALSGSISRTNPDGSPRTRQKQALSSDSATCLFTPGDSWHDPLWAGAGDWSVSLPNDEARILTDLVNPGPSTFKGIFIDGDVPVESSWGGGAVHKIFAGHNIKFGQIPGRSLSGDPDIIDINAVGGGGEGYPEREPEVIDYVAFIGGASPDSKGNVNVQGVDCLRVFRPVDEGGEIVPAIIQINSDCLPCCSCSSYRNFSRSIGRRSAKLKDLCNRLDEILQGSANAYNDAIDIINRNRKPLVVARNVRVLGSKITFSTQNLSSIPVFAYVQVHVVQSEYPLGEMASSEVNTVVVETASFGGNHHDAVAANKLLLPPLPFSPAERILAEIPETGFSQTGAAILLSIGSLSSDGDMAPLSPGEIVEHTILLPDRAAEMLVSGTAGGSAAAAFPELVFQTIAVYGASRCYACSADVHHVKVVERAVVEDELESCELNLADHFEALPVK